VAFLQDEICAAASSMLRVVVGVAVIRCLHQPMVIEGGLDFKR